MKRQKIILKHCPHFYKILDFEIYEDDAISSKLISLYKDYIFSIDVTDERALKKAEKIDLIISKYIDDYLFRKELQRECVNIKIDSSEDITTGLIEGIFNLYDNYENGYTRNIYFARWI